LDSFRRVCVSRTEWLRIVAASAHNNSYHAIAWKAAPLIDGASLLTALSEALRDPCEALTLQKRQYLLGQLVGLGHHGGAGLLQDLCTRQVGGLLREVGVQNA